MTPDIVYFSVMFFIAALVTGNLAGAKRPVVWALLLTIVFGAFLIWDK